jgi:release factor glutamine methyltransferase
MNSRTLLIDAQARLAITLGLDAREARLEARILLQATLGVHHAWLLAHETDPLEETTCRQFESSLQRRLAGEPIAYILGQREFFGLTLKVTPATLIPRPDTETLVEAALERIPEQPHGAAPYKVLDMGTGTGAIALAIASQCPYAQVTATDQSKEALDVAQENAHALGLDRCVLILSDWYAGLSGEQYDLIVSNPPYIQSNDPHLQQGDLRFEPSSALAAGDDGLKDIRQIVSGASAHLKPQGWLMLEHGYDQADAVAACMRVAGFQNIGHRRDIAGIARVTYGQWLE